MGLLESGATWLLDTLQIAAGRPATYRRSGRRIPVTAVRREIDQRAVDANGKDIVVREYEFTVDVADLPWEPQAGDIIEETINGEAVRWEVIARGDGASWEWWDVARTAYRLSVQEV